MEESFSNHFGHKRVTVKSWSLKPKKHVRILPLLVAFILAISSISKRKPFHDVFLKGF